jgi:hypothetical protein
MSLSSTYDTYKLTSVAMVTSWKIEKFIKPHTDFDKDFYTWFWHISEPFFVAICKKLTNDLY